VLLVILGGLHFISSFGFKYGNLKVIIGICNSIDIASVNMPNHFKIKLNVFPLQNVMEQVLRYGCACDLCYCTFKVI